MSRVLRLLLAAVLSAVAMSTAATPAAFACTPPPTVAPVPGATPTPTPQPATPTPNPATRSLGSGPVTGGSFISFSSSQPVGRIYFGGQEGLVTSPPCPGTVTAQVPAGEPGTVDVFVADPYGSPRYGPIGTYTYEPAITPTPTPTSTPRPPVCPAVVLEPAIRSISPTSGGSGGGDLVEVVVDGEASSVLFTQVTQTPGIDPLTDVPAAVVRREVLPAADCALPQTILVVRVPYSLKGISSVRVPGASGSLSYTQGGPDDPEPVPGTLGNLAIVSPSTGPASGGTPIRVYLETGLTEAPSSAPTLRFGGTDGTPVPVDSVDTFTENNRLWLILNATAPAGTPGAVALVAVDGATSLRGRIYTYEGTPSTPTPTVTPTPTPTPTVDRFRFSVAGGARLASLTRGNIGLEGTLDAEVAPSGAITADMQLADTSATLKAFGFLPVSTQLGFTGQPLAPSGENTTGSVTAGGLKLTSSQTIRLRSASVFGIPLVYDERCATKQPSTLGLAAASLDPSAGGRLNGTLDISDLENCGFLTFLLSPLTKSTGNQVTLDLTPAG